MSELIFVRHGQASFGAASYDALSERGFEQVRELARHWLETEESFQAISQGLCNDKEKRPPNWLQWSRIRPRRSAWNL